MDVDREAPFEEDEDAEVDKEDNEGQGNLEDKGEPKKKMKKKDKDKSKARKARKASTKESRRTGGTGTKSSLRRGQDEAAGGGSPVKPQRLYAQKKDHDYRRDL